MVIFQAAGLGICYFDQSDRTCGGSSCSVPAAAVRIAGARPRLSWRPDKSREPLGRAEEEARQTASPEMTQTDGEGGEKGAEKKTCKRILQEHPEAGTVHGLSKSCVAGSPTADDQCCTYCRAITSEK